MKRNLFSAKGHTEHSLISNNGEVMLIKILDFKCNNWLKTCVSTDINL